MVWYDLPYDVTLSTTDDVHRECRECGANVGPEVDECPECGGGIAAYEL